MTQTYDAVIVGSGPNGLAAAITLARQGRRVKVIEGKDQIGGGTRTAELTLPGFLHDICSAIHPMGVASPFFRSVSLKEFGLEWVYSPAAVAHPLDDGTAAALYPSFEETGETLGPDAAAYRRLLKPLVDNWQKLLEDILGPFPLPPKHPILLALFGLKALRSARGLANSTFKGKHAKALLSGISGHSILGMDKPISASFGLVLAMLGHAVGWPVAVRGSQSITKAMAAYLETLGGEIETGHFVESLDELPPAGATLLDVTPRQLIRIAGNRLPDDYRFQLTRYRYGLGVFKLDWGLSEPIPWKAGACRRAATVHVGGTIEEMAASENAAWKGQDPEKPFVLLAQQSLFDPTRAPDGKHTGWGYCHVPNGSEFDMTERIESQIERFAPGFRDCILERRVTTPAEMEEYNPNYIGGDINGGVQDIWQLFTRPTFDLTPYRTPVKGVYLCSSSTPPGGAVHGMCGYHAARAAMREAKAP